MTEQRVFSRINFVTNVVLLLSDTAYFSGLIDLSLKGALLAQPDNWSGRVGDQVKLKIELAEPAIEADEASHICFNGTVVHSDSGRIGIRCDDIDIDSATVLRRVLELNVGDAEQINRELSQLGS
jgi:hypothetical protein